MRVMIRTVARALCLLSLPAASAWLTTGGAAPPLLRPALPPLGALARLPPSDDGEGSLPESGVDWDSAWSAELAKRGEGKREWRPEGREAVSAEQVAKAKAKRTADDLAVSLQQASADWRFWFGVIAFIS
ncbi:MAG: hypothetical protein SGPRY_009718, partial [Prymnesium sp.]